MPTIGYRLLAAVVCLVLVGQAAPATPPTLRRGINITHWFRYPPNREPAALRGYLDDAALQALRQAGFDFVRLSVQPDLATQRDALMSAVTRLEEHGLKVIVALHADDWHLETDAAQREQLLATWRSLAAILRRASTATTLPEILNEPVFTDDPDAWANLQHRAMRTIRAILPDNTIVLTGADWGSVRGLLALRPEADSNVVYSFHLYEPAELTALGAYRAGLDRDAMARLPFPADDAAACARVAATTKDAQTAALIRFYCDQGWDTGRVAARIDAAASWARRNRVGVILGEFGASQRLNAAARLAWLAAIRTACERQPIGWALWGYDDAMGFGLRPPAAHRFDPLLLQALGLQVPIMAK